MNGVFACMCLHVHVARGGGSASSSICAALGVLQQVDEALAADDEMRLNKDLEKEMTAIQDDVKLVRYQSL